MAVWALGINHNTAPLDLRGRFAFALDQIAPTLQGLRSALTSATHHPQVETAILSTCNRTEVYCASDNVQIDHTLGWLAKAGDVSPAALHEHTYVLQNDQAARQPQAIAIANRTLERGEKLATRFSAEVMRLADLPERLHEFDAVVSCTASTLPIIGLGAVERALKKRRHRPIFMVDLAVPRDIEPEVKALGDVYLYTVDDLAQVVQTGQANRQAAVAQAEAIIDAGVQSFMHWIDQRDPAGGVVPLIQQLNAQADEWRALELARARKRLAKGDDVEAVLEALSRGLTQKMLHGAMAELRAADPAHREQATQAVERLFLRGKPATPSLS